MGDGFGIGASNAKLAAVSPKDNRLSKVGLPFNTAAGGMGEGFGIGASNCIKVPVLVTFKLRSREATASAAGGIGDGFGIGAFNMTEVPVAASVGFCSCTAAGGIGDGFGIGASKAGTSEIAAPWEFSWQHFKLEKVLMVELPGEKGREAAPKFIPNTANASVITDIF
jgi:hypothetical protein